LLERFGITKLRDKPISGLSSGENTRVGLCKAFMNDPRLLLLDEPFTGLDEAAREALRARLRSARDAGAIVLLTTHDLAAIAQLTDASMSLVGGRLQ